MSTTEARWLTKFDDKGPWAPFWLGFTVTVSFVLLRCAFDGFFLLTWGFPDGSYPLWQMVWWPEIVNAALLGFVPAALVFTRRGVIADLIALRPWLSGGDSAITDIRAAAFRPAGFAGKAIMFCVFAGACYGVFMEPSLTSSIESSSSNPPFLWAVLRIPVFAWWFVALIRSDLNVTRAYRHTGRNLIEVDLLDVQSLAPFARRGLRSALMWVLFLIIFSLFWLGDGTASRQNPWMFVLVLTMAISAFVVPLTGVHANILLVKQAELARLREEIRTTEEITDSPRLANLIAYYQLIDRAREWPIDAANLLRLFFYLLLGLGSWLGGAVVERLLDSSLGG